MLFHRRVPAGKSSKVRGSSLLSTFVAPPGALRPLRRAPLPALLRSLRISVSPLPAHAFESRVPRRAPADPAPLPSADACRRPRGTPPLLHELDRRARRSPACQKPARRPESADGPCRRARVVRDAV